jgi:hypothetical protein
VDLLSPSELGRLFSAVGEALEQNRLALNLADPVNGDHGDHMVAIFQVAAQAARENPEMDLPQAMQAASERLAALSANDSARLYAVGLSQMSRQFQAYGVTTAGLVSYVRSALADKSQPGIQAPEKPENAGAILKALMAGLAAWGRIESGQPPADNPLDMGTLFEFGMAYMQAKQRGGARLQVLADAACAVSPLSRIPYRTESGRIAIQALLQAMQS